MKKIIFVAAVSALSLSCKTWEGDDTPPQTSNLLGSWKSPCLNSAVFPAVDPQFKLVEEKKLALKDLENLRFTYVQNFKEYSFTTEWTVYEDTVCTKKTNKIDAPANKTSEYKVNSSQLGTINTMDIDPDSKTPKFTIFKIDGVRLYLGKKSEGRDGSKLENRHEDLDGNFYLTKEEKPK